MSVIIVAFEAAPKACEQARQKEAELDARLENKVKGALVTLLYRLFVRHNVSLLLDVFLPVHLFV